MKPSNIRQLIAEDFAPEDRQMIARLGGVLNYFMRQITEILNENVDFDNLTWDLITVNVTVDANGVPNQTTKFSSDVQVPRGLTVIKATNLTNTVTYPDNAPFVSFTPEGSGISKINHVTGLQADNTYQLVLMVI